jgi:predicted transcriptional regulator
MEQQLSLYPNAPGYSNPTTSKDAAKSMEPKASALRIRILSELQVRASFGATCDELEQAMSLSHQTASARLREMVLAGSIVDSEQKRRTRSGRGAIVWYAKEGWR